MEIFNLHQYKAKPLRDEASATLLRFKHKQPKAMAHYHMLLATWIKQNINLPHVIIAMPSHKKDNTASLELLLPTLCRQFPLLTHGRITKLRDTPSQALTGMRNYQRLLTSLRIESNVYHKHVLFVDDVSVTGTSFRALSTLAERMDALSITCLALATSKTQIT